MNERRSFRSAAYTAAGVAVFATIVTGCGLLAGGSSDEVSQPTTTVVGNSAFVGCLECHADVDADGLNGRSVILMFDHRTHELASGSVGCGSCHPVNTHEGTSTIRPAMDTCFDCHGVNAGAPLDCASCHPLSVVPRPPSHLDVGWDRTHGIALIDAEPACATCHSQTKFCTACHGLEMPHPEGWEAAEHAYAFFERPEDGCSNCHGLEAGSETRTDCDSCHHPGGAPEETWLIAHPGVVKYVGGGSCFACHDPSTCVTCHVHGVLDLSADWARLREVEP